jgi:hypothetical protein
MEFLAGWLAGIRGLVSCWLYMLACFLAGFDGWLDGWACSFAGIAGLLGLLGF